jgi:hypothetical protein
LDVRKPVFKEYADVSHLARNFVGESGNNDWGYDMHVSRGKAHSNAKAIEEVVDERRK